MISNLDYPDINFVPSWDHFWTHFESSWDLKQVLTNYLTIYNHHIPQKSLGHTTPIEALKAWQQQKPQLFKKRVYHLTGSDIY